VLGALPVTLRDAWEDNAERWTRWARAPGHDSYWRFHRDAFFALVPPPGRCTLDIGCGEGRVLRELTGRGHRAVGLEVSAVLARHAAETDGTHRVVRADAAALPLAPASADLVVSFMMLQDVDAWREAVAEFARVLVAGGRLALAIVHPINSAGAFDGWRHGTPGTKPVGGAMPPFVIEESWFAHRRNRDEIERDGLEMVFFSEHRPLQDYTEALSAVGFLIERLREVGEPDPEHMWSKMPLFLHLLCVRGPVAGSP
jgi:SAM-dependent methyltransferase